MKGGYLGLDVAAAQIYQSKMKKIGYMGIKSSAIIILERMDMLGHGYMINFGYTWKIKRKNLMKVEQNRITSLKLGPRRYYSNFFKSH